MRRVYLDNNATTAMRPEVVEALRPYLTEEYGNASSIHSFGQRARAAVERARAEVAALIGAQPKEIIFTSGGTESDNLAIFGVLNAAKTKQGGKKHVVTSAIEHHAVLNACQQLEKMGVDVTYIPVGSEGIVDPDDVRRAIRPETVLITIMHANNELGTLQPIEEIGKIAQEADLYFHTDAVQTAGKLPIEVRKLGVDLLSLSAHKLHGPKGVGALYVHRGVHLQALFYGGHHQRDLRPGTENVFGIIGLGKAAELARKEQPAPADRMAKMRDGLEGGILTAVPHTGVNGSRDRRLPNTTNIYFEFIEGEALVIALDLKGVACSTGAACSSGAIEPSHVLTAIGRPPETARASLRFSFGHLNTVEDVDDTLKVLPETVHRLRELSPLYQKPTTVNV